MRAAAALLPALLLAAACPGREGTSQPVPPLPVAIPEPVPVSGPSPFPPGCNGVQRGVHYIGSAVEPTLAVDPGDPSHLVAAWQQDRWSNGGASGNLSAVSFDGGARWTASGAAFTFCSGGSAYQRASDPWVTIAPGGVAFQLALTFDGNDSAQAILASRSADGGVTWSPPVALAADIDPGVALDKGSITADPTRPGHVYAVWDRLTGLDGPIPLQAGPAWLARSVDGVGWEAPRIIFDPGPDAQTISNQVAVLPDGTLLDLLVIITASSSQSPAVQVAVLRSTDGGTGWSAPLKVADVLDVGTADPATGHYIRGGSLVPAIAVDSSSGAIHVVWQDARFSGGARDGIALSSSADGGLTWSPPRQVNRAPAVQAFTASVAAAGGRVAVSYYDLRLDDPADGSRLWTVHWLAWSGDGGATWGEVPVGGPFDLTTAPDAGGWFLGDYMALVARGADLTPLFVATDASRAPGRTLVLAAAPSLSAAAIPGPARQQRVVPRGLADLVRDRREIPVRP